MKYLLAFIAAFLAAVFTASLSPYVKILGVAPDFVLILAACWAMVRGQNEAMAVVPLAGVLRDLTTSDPLGLSVLALSPIVLLASLREFRPIETDFVPALAVVAVASVSYSIIGMTVLTAAGDDVPWGTALLRLTVPSLIVNPLFAVLFYPPIRWLSPRPKPASFGVGSAVQL